MNYLSDVGFAIGVFLFLMLGGIHCNIVMKHSDERVKREELERLNTYRD